jgi:hypothetical protein
VDAQAADLLIASQPWRALDSSKPAAPAETAPEPARA